MVIIAVEIQWSLSPVFCTQKSYTFIKHWIISIRCCLYQFNIPMSISPEKKWKTPGIIFDPLCKAYWIRTTAQRMKTDIKTNHNVFIAVKFFLHQPSMSPLCALWPLYDTFFNYSVRFMTSIRSKIINLMWRETRHDNQPSF